MRHNSNKTIYKGTHRKLGASMDGCWTKFESTRFGVNVALLLIHFGVAGVNDILAVYPFPLDADW